MEERWERWSRGGRRGVAGEGVAGEGGWVREWRGREEGERAGGTQVVWQARRRTGAGMMLGVVCTRMGGSRPVPRSWLLTGRMTCRTRGGAQHACTTRALVALEQRTSCPSSDKQPARNSLEEAQGNTR